MAYAGTGTPRGRVRRIAISGIDRHRYPSARKRSIDLETWTGSGIPPLHAARAFVTELHRLHLPQPGSTVVAVLDVRHRVTASASFAVRPHVEDGWHHRNAILAHLRQVTAHDLRLAGPTRTAVLLRCREGSGDWTEQDGAWMWALRDAATLHGLRCGSYIALTPTGWQSLGDGHRGRTPHSGSWAEGPLHTVTELTPSSVREPAPERAWRPTGLASVETVRRTAAR
ncbi:hypothetical protein [Kitasatospora sp. HPMI-4]|uniref:hypothetical protein n=1 Tax=Kitasatospora sp. HPMI-4 TaxID=3448443 RepID=UPI003F1B3251